MMLSKHSRRHVLQGTVRVHGVVVGEPVRQLRHYSLGVTQIPEGNVISFNRLNKALSHPIGLRALHRIGERVVSPSSRQSDGGHFCWFWLLPVLNGWQLPVGRMRPILVVILDPLLGNLSDLFEA